VTTAFETRTIEQAIETLIDYRGKTPPKTTHGVPLITAKVIKGGFIQQENPEFIAIDFYDAWMRRGLPKQWDVLITTEAPLGEVAQIRKAERIALAQRVILLRGNPKVVDQGYLYQAMKSDFVQGELKARASGTTVLGIKQSELWKVKIPWHTLPTQRKIARVLSAYDDLIENNSRRIAILEEMAQAIYREWFVNFRFPGRENVKLIYSPLGKIPEGWRVAKLEDAVYVNPRVTVPKNGEKFFVSMGAIPHNTMLIDVSALERRTGNSGAKFQNADTLFARITPCLENGKTAFVQFLNSSLDVAFGSTEFIVLRSKTVCPEFVYLLARSDPFRDNAIKSMSGATGRQRVQEKCFDKFFIAHPDSTTLSDFSAVMQPLFRHVFMLDLKNCNLRQTRDLLLPKLISGQLDVEDLDIDIGEPPVEATT
jgi:type I restriction enzyme S subunit